MTFFPHLDLDLELAQLNRLAGEGLALAYHADADGAVSAALLAQLPEARVTSFGKVPTEQLLLREISVWAKQLQVHNLVTLDINVWSTPEGLRALASSVTGTITVIDDHMGKAGQLPANVRMIDLLPPGPRTQRSDQIRPAFLFADAILHTAVRRRSSFNAFLALAATYGEGVEHLFPMDDISAGHEIRRLARQFGRGLTAALLIDETGPNDAIMVGSLLQLATEPTSVNGLGDAALRAANSPLGKNLVEASNSVTTLVRDEVSSSQRPDPWLTTSELTVRLLELKTKVRIVNLVASEARNGMDRGLAVAVQERPGGHAVELRRTRDLDHPDLAEVLLSIDASYFVSRGGHPMAAGATVLTSKIDSFLRVLREKLATS